MSFEALTYVKQLDLGDANTGSNHLLLRSIAEHTFNDTGLCRLSQKQLAVETHCSDRHLSRLLATLEERGLIRRYPQYDTNNGGRKPDAIEIIGFADWHAALTGKPIKLRDDDGDEGAGGTQQPAEEDTRQNVRGGIPDKMSGGDTCHGSQGDTGHSCQVHIRNPGTRQVPSPPHPPQGGREREGRSSKFDEVFDHLIATHRDPDNARRIVDGFLKPSVSRLKVRHEDPAALFEGCLVASLLEASDQVLGKAVEILSGTRKLIMSPRCLLDAVEVAKSETRLGERWHASQSVTLTKADNRQEFAAWAKWAEANQKTVKQARMIRRFIQDLGCSEINVPSRWPPTKAETAEISSKGEQA